MFSIRPASTTTRRSLAAIGLLGGLGLAPCNTGAQQAPASIGAVPRLVLRPGRAEVVVPVPRDSLWRWGQPRPRVVVDGGLEILWPSGRTVEVLHMGRHELPTQEGFGWHWSLDSASVPQAGSLADLLRAGRGVEYQYSWCGEFSCYSTYAEATVQVVAQGDSAIVLSLGSSSLLHRLKQLRPDTVSLRFHAPGNRKVWWDAKVPVDDWRPR